MASHLTARPGSEMPKQKGDLKAADGRAGGKLVEAIGIEQL
jgi:hypothetical protein